MIDVKELQIVAHNTRVDGHDGRAKLIAEAAAFIARVQEAAGPVVDPVAVLERLPVNAEGKRVAPGDIQYARSLFDEEIVGMNPHLVAENGISTYHASIFGRCYSTRAAAEASTKTP